MCGPSARTSARVPSIAASAPLMWWRYWARTAPMSTVVSGNALTLLSRGERFAAPVAQRCGQRRLEVEVELQPVARCDRVDVAGEAELARERRVELDHVLEPPPRAL